MSAHPKHVCLSSLGLHSLLPNKTKPLQLDHDACQTCLCDTHWPLYSASAAARCFAGKAAPPAPGCVVGTSPLPLVRSSR